MPCSEALRGGEGGRGDRLAGVRPRLGAAGRAERDERRAGEQGDGAGQRGAWLKPCDEGAVWRVGDELLALRAEPRADLLRGAERATSRVGERRAGAAVGVVRDAER